MPPTHPRKLPTRPCDPAHKQRQEIASAKATGDKRGLRSALVEALDKIFMIPPTLSHYARGWSVILSDLDQKAHAKPSIAGSRSPGPEGCPPHAIVALQNGTTHKHKTIRSDSAAGTPTGAGGRD